MGGPLSTAPAARPRLVLATGNPGKLREIRAIFHEHGVAAAGWEILAPEDLGIALPHVVETGRSYAENAILKAVATARVAALPALADDSGLEVDALDGRPGVLSARFGGPRMRGDRDRNALILQQLAGLPRPRRTARFRAVVALAIPGNRPMTREGLVEGRVALEPRGDHGFGYDPIFELPDGRTMAEIGDEKQQLSHRARALRAMADVIADLLRRPEYAGAWRGADEGSPFHRTGGGGERT